MQNIPNNYHQNTILRKKFAVIIPKNDKKWFFDKTYKKFFSMIFLTGIFFIAELIGGLLFNSLTLLSDSFHMLSDIIALIIGVYAFGLSKKSNKYSSFGMDRASIIGGLVNSSFLLAICLSIIIEAVQRLIEIISNINNLDKQHNFTILDSNTNNLIIISSLGLFINIIGLCIFHQQSDSDNNFSTHGHSHRVNQNRTNCYLHHRTCCFSDIIFAL